MTLSRPTTCTGVDWFSTLPLPKRPPSPSPQQYALPDTPTAQLALSPRATSMARSGSPMTMRASSFSPSGFGFTVPSPSWPNPLPPQQSTPPSLVRAQMCPPPFPTATMPSNPGSRVGVSAPQPHATTSRSDKRAAVPQPPPATCSTPDVMLVMRTGAALAVASGNESASAQRPLSPQHQTLASCATAQVWLLPRLISRSASVRATHD